MNIWKDTPDEHKMFLIGSIIVPLVLWWIYIGRKTYSMKGKR